MRILFPGTSSAIPAPGNGFTCFLVQAGGALVLVDTGDNPVRAILEAGCDPLELNAVVLTHRHVDHLGAFAALVSSLDCLKRPAPLDVIAAEDARERARRLLELFDMPTGKTCFALRYADVWQGGGLRLDLRPGNHSVPTSMLLARHGDAGLLYAADCLHRPGLVAANASGCSSLIHEATYPQACLPAATGHSSARQAGRAAREAGVRQLFLCHFEPAAWSGAGDPAAEAGGEFGGELIVPQPGRWYTVSS